MTEPKESFTPPDKNSPSISSITGIEAGVNSNHPKGYGAEGCNADRPWQKDLRDSIRSSRTLYERLQLPLSTLEATMDGHPEFPILVPESYLARIKPQDPDDPLLLQVMAQLREREPVHGYTEDPLEERQFTATGLIRKYPGRALLVTTAACPIHCRYCFRRHFPYGDNLATRSNWEDSLRTLRDDPSIKELILSGGDPLSLSTKKLTELIQKLESISTIETLRIHTRFPIAIPERVTDELLALLRSTRFNTVVVVHCNHPNELDDAQVKSALRSLANAVNFVLNQSVLLRGVNDDASTLSLLSTRLFAAGVLPYYLHLLDRVSGSAHFEITEKAARKLVKQLRHELPGYLVPKLVFEQSGELSKTPVN